MPGLLDWIPRQTRGYTAPRHLARLIEVLERAQTQSVRAVVHAPPRHAKTETILQGFGWSLAKDPTRTHGYVTYAADLSRSKSRRARDFTRGAGVELADDAAALHEWRTKQGGGLLATGVGGPLTGQGISGMLVVDDPVKNRVEAESSTIRERVWDWFNDVAFTRLEPGSSVIVVMTRWHPKDLSGRLVDEKGWEFICLPALNDGSDPTRAEGEPLWPERFNTDTLGKIREQVGEYTWSSLYQGRPRKRGGALFADVHYYDFLPTQGYRVGLGFDLAYSKKTSADYSVALTMYEAGGLYYVVEVAREQLKADEFKKVARPISLRFPRAARRWYAYGPEIGVATLFGQPDEGGPGVDVGARPGVGDKFVRAQPVAAAWNAGKVLVPRDAPWLDAFLAEVEDFTGVGDDHDDQVDGLAAAFDALGGAPAPTHDEMPDEEFPRSRVQAESPTEQSPWGDDDDLDDEGFGGRRI